MALLIKWINFNPRMDNESNVQQSVGWNYLSIPNLQWLHRWDLGMKKKFYPTRYRRCDYLSMMELKLIHVSERGYWCTVVDAERDTISQPQGTTIDQGTVSLMGCLSQFKLGEVCFPIKLFLTNWLIHNFVQVTTTVLWWHVHDLLQSGSQESYYSNVTFPPNFNHQQ